MKLIKINLISYLEHLVYSNITNPYAVRLDPHLFNVQDDYDLLDKNYRKSNYTSILNKLILDSFKKGFVSK